MASSNIFSAAMLQMVFLAALARADEPPVSFTKEDGKVQVLVGGKRLATYVYRDEKVLRPYFAHIVAPNGVQATRNYPPIEGRDATDHATMHPGLWLAFGDLGGADFWRNKGAVRFVEFVEDPRGGAGTGRFAVRNRYEAGGKTICEETCRVSVKVLPAGYLFLWDSDFKGNGDFTFGDQEEMGLGVRVATALTVKSGGRIANSDGLKNEKQVWGKQADWCACEGAIDGKRVGVLLMPDPRNFRRSWFHARDYGLLVANPFGQNAFTRGEKSKVVVKEGESLRLRFGALVYSEPIDPAAAYKTFLESAGMQKPEGNGSRDRINPPGP